MLVSYWIILLTPWIWIIERRMLENSHDIVLMPVVHGYTLKEIKRACAEIKDIIDPKVVGVGSLVPILKYMKTSTILKLNGMNTIKL